MAKVIDKKGNRVQLSIFGIRIKFKINDFINNKVYLTDTDGTQKRIYRSPKGVKITFLGKDSLVVLPKNGCFNNLTVICNTNSKLQIDKLHDWGITNLLIELGNYSKVHINKNFSSVGAFITAFGLNSSIDIGEDCMFSNNILIRNHDGHTLIDKLSGKIINDPKDVVIGNHCWLSKGVTILKGVKLPNNTVVAANAVVSKSFEQEDIVLAGNPAKIVRTNTSWDRRFNESYRREMETYNG